MIDNSNSHNFKSFQNSNSISEIFKSSGERLQKIYSEQSNPILRELAVTDELRRLFTELNQSPLVKSFRYRVDIEDEERKEVQ